jgi:YHS domain-containing protein
MEVDERSAAGQSDYQGQTYYFAVKAAKNKFNQTPPQYARTGDKVPGSPRKSRRHLSMNPRRYLQSRLVQNFVR